MVWFLIIVVSVLLDQYTKYLAMNKLIEYDTYPIFEGVFHLTYVENRGAAFGMFQNKKILFVVITSLILIAIVYYILKYKPKSKLLLISLSIIIGGALGNLIDRVRFGYVVDFLDFNLINWPVFNVADSLVVIGTILLSYYLIFMYEEKKEKEGEV
jgi:signal peptidase II